MCEAGHELVTQYQSTVQCHNVLREGMKRGESVNNFLAPLETTSAGILGLGVQARDIRHWKTSALGLVGICSAGKPVRKSEHAQLSDSDTRFVRGGSGRDVLGITTCRHVKSKGRSDYQPPPPLFFLSFGVEDENPTSHTETDPTPDPAGPGRTWQCR